MMLIKDHTYEALSAPDLMLFDDHERETLEYVRKFCQSHGAKKLYELSHQEKGYKETPECAFINYEFAKDLLILPKGELRG